MSHVNITLPEPHSNEWQARLNYQKLMAEKAHVETLLQQALSNLRSIFDRIDANEPVYLQYPDGRRICIQAVPDEPGEPVR